MRPLSSVSRVHQTKRTLEIIATEVKEWLEAFQKLPDAGKRHSTQLATLKAFVDDALEWMRPGLGTLGDGTLDDVFRACRDFDARLLCIRRVWSYFRERFDQRRDPTWSPLLVAADEVVWSCHKQVRDQLALRATGAPLLPVPLPYVDGQYAPAAFPASTVPADLTTAGEFPEFVREFLDELPIPLIRVPPSARVAPGGLALLAHEYGHVLQNDLLPRHALVASWTASVVAAATAAGAPPESAKAYGRRGEEIFADAASAGLVGAWAAGVLAEVDYTPASDRFTSRLRYLSPGMRLAFLGELCGGWKEADIVPFFRGLALDPGAGDLAILGGLVALVDTPLAGLLPGPGRAAAPTLRELCTEPGVTMAVEVRAWSTRLVGAAPVPARPVPLVRDARFVAAAIAEAWDEVAANATPMERDAALDALADLGLDLLRRCHVPGDHAGGSAVSSRGAEFAALLSGRSARELEGEA